MFKKTNAEPTALDKAIAKILEKMEDKEPDSAEYAKMVEQLEKLNKIKNLKKDPLVSPDTLVAVGGNLAGIIAILSFEKVNVITTKALGFVMKSRM